MRETTPRILYVESTTRCNLSCSMCVKQAEHSCIPERDMPFSVYEKLLPAFPSLEGLVLNGIGEPLLHPRLADMVGFAREHMPAEAWIGFQTNGLLLNRDKAFKLVRAGLDTVCISVDAVFGDGENLSHGGEDVTPVARAFVALREVGERLGVQVRSGVEFVLMRDTFRALPRSLEWAAGQGASFAIVTHMLPYGTEVERQAVFNPNTRESLEFFRQWQAFARERGHDLTEYLGGLWRFPKDDRRKALEKFVADMHREAARQGLPLHLSNLVKWSAPEVEAEQEELQRVLRRAEQVAADSGLELVLPPQAAALNRRCDFMEKGVMHISPDGGVHPCYSLWHEYSSCMDGELKHITPRSFGNVLDRDVLSIWNDPAYAEFRKAVLEYDYPYCGNCNVAPCSDVRGYAEGFIKDCYGIEVPCGHCEWCMGGVRCLV